MRKQRGIADGWLLLIVLAVFAGGLWYAYNKIDERGYTRGKLEVQQRFDQYKAEVAELGRKAQARADKQKAEDLERQAKANDKAKRDLAAVRADAKRMRDERARTSVVPPASAGTGGSDRVCFNRGDLERALRDFEEGVGGLLDEGDECRVKFNSAKRWAQP